MQRKNALVLILVMLIFLCACNSNGNASTEQYAIPETNKTTETVSTPTYYGTWENMGLASLSNNLYYISITISQDSIVFESSEEKIGPLDYIESYDKYHTYLEVNDPSLSCVIVILNDDMLGMCFPTDESSDFNRAYTPWGTKFDAEVYPGGSCYLRQDSGKTELPSYLDLNMLLGENADNCEYEYYPNARLLEVYSTDIGYACYHIYEGGGADYIETLGPMSMKDYGPEQIITDAGYIITDNT